jgi:hypothetical protein
MTAIRKIWLMKILGLIKFLENPEKEWLKEYNP